MAAWVDLFWAVEVLVFGVEVLLVVVTAVVKLVEAAVHTEHNNSFGLCQGLSSPS